MADCAGLTGNAAACNAADDVELAVGVSDIKRLTNKELESFKAKVIIDVSVINGDFAAACINADSCY